MCFTGYQLEPHLSNGPRAVCYQPLDEALAGIAAVTADYAAHSRAARQLAGQMFDARQVLADLITQAGA